MPPVWAGAYLAHLQKEFRQKEPYYSLPLYSQKSEFILRSDAGGKGYFGAPRGGGRRHEGIDILSPLGQPVVAAKSGRVTFSGLGKGYGLYVEILHPDGLRTRYAHLQKFYVSLGDWVTEGSVLGTSGKSGNASGQHIKPHLHFEILAPQGPLNPMLELLHPKYHLSSGDFSSLTGLEMTH